MHPVRTALAPLLLVLVLLAPAPHGPVVPAFAADSGPETKHDPAPTVLPDRIILTWPGDPATSQAVTWRTSDAVKEARAEIAPAEPSPDFTRDARMWPAASEPLLTESGPALCHSVVFTGLSPNTLYAYRVGSEEGWSEWFQFRTAEAGPAPFSFLYFGDAQSRTLEMWSRVIRAAFAAAPDARFLLHAGDLVDDGDDDTMWGEWFRAGGWIHATVPSVPAIGNHEYAGDDTPPAHWRAQFTLPENGIAGLEETNYFIDYQSLRVLVLDSNARLEDQARWLEETLRANPKKWTIATFHHPIWSATTERDNVELRDLWKPLFERYGVDLVLQGHDHTYARGRNVAGAGDLPAGRDGPVYVVSVSGRKMYDLPERSWWDRAAENTQLFQVISIDGDTLRFEAFTSTGRPFDSFAIGKPGI